MNITTQTKIAAIVGLVLLTACDPMDSTKISTTGACSSSTQLLGDKDASVADVNFAASCAIDIKDTSADNCHSVGTYKDLNPGVSSGSVFITITARDGTCNSNEALPYSYTLYYQILGQGVIAMQNQ